MSSSVSNSVEGFVGNAGNAVGDIGVGAGDAVGNLKSRGAVGLQPIIVATSDAVSTASSHLCNII